jgi:hypothetical protein
LVAGWLEKIAIQSKSCCRKTFVHGPSIAVRATKWIQLEIDYRSPLHITSWQHYIGKYIAKAYNYLK